MWPFRPANISAVLSDDAIRELLLLGGDVTVSFVEAVSDDEFRSIDANPRREESFPDPFCSFFRHGRAEGRVAFSGADEACAACEQKFVGIVTMTEEGRSNDATLHRRCHMGLTDFLVPVSVGGRRIGSLIAGRVVKEAGDRGRIRKIVERLGSQTRSEAASSRGDSEPIQPASDKARKRLLHEIDGLQGKRCSLRQ